MPVSIMLVIFLISFVSAEIVCENGVVAHYPFDGNALDFSGNNYDGIEHGMSYQTGQLNEAAVFLGNISSYVILPNETFDGRNQFTVAFWMMSTGKGDNMVSVVKGNDDNNNEFAVKNQDDLKATYKNDGDHFNEALNDGNWHFIVVSVDSLNKGMSVYVDGEFIRTSGIKNESIIAKGVVIGQDQGKLISGFDQSQSYLGLIDELSIFDRPLTGSQVTDLYNSGDGMQVCKETEGDTTPPVITIVSPMNKVYNSSNIDFLVNINELGTTKFSLNNGQNISMSTNNGLNFEYLASLSDGNYNLQVYATDLAGNIASQSVSFVINSSIGNPGNNPLIITILNPQSTTYNTGSIDFLVNLNRPGSLVFNLNNGPNVSMGTSNGLNFNYSQKNLVSGSYIFRVYAEDLSGNKNTSSIIFSVNLSGNNPGDTTPPVVVILIPNQVAYNTNIPIVVQINEPGFCSYRLNTMPSKNMTDLGNLTFVDYPNLSDDVYLLRATCRDLAGNLNSSEFSFIINSSLTCPVNDNNCTNGTNNDTTPPVINIVSPNQTVYNSTVIPIIVTTNENATCKYTINDWDTVEL